MKTINFFKFTMTAISCIVVLALTAYSDDDDKTPQLKFSANKIEMTAGSDSVVIVKGGTAPYTATSTSTEIATATTKGDSIIIAAVKDGTATIQVTDHAKLTGCISIEVKAAATLTPDKDQVSVSVGQESTVTIKDGNAPYAVTSKDAATATATVKDNTVTIKGVKAGTTQVVITDKDSKTVTVSITVK